MPEKHSVLKMRETNISEYLLIETRIGYSFKDRSLLQLALTHSSVHGGRQATLSNERLEFLGDRVLGLAIAEILLEKFPNEIEGTSNSFLGNTSYRSSCSILRYSYPKPPPQYCSSGVI